MGYAEVSPRGESARADRRAHVLDPNLWERLRTPQRAHVVSFPFRRDDYDTVETVFGYRVQHLLTMDPTKGGLRYDLGVNLGDTTALAMWMSWIMDTYSQQKGHAVPDILANAGGVTVSDFEWVQGLQQFLWEENEVNERLNRLMLGAYREVAEVARREKINLRSAAMMRGIDRICEAKPRRGVFP